MVNKTIIGIGLLLTTFGIAILLAWWAYEIFISEMHVIPKIALFLLFIGVLTILWAVIVNRLKIRKTDPYKDVEF